MASENLILYEHPTLREPYLVAGFSGWLDGGEASTGTLKYLIGKLGATKLAEIQTKDFTVFQLPGLELIRPHIKINDGVVKELRFPKNEVFYWQKPEGPAVHDLILLLGVEPNQRWHLYTETVLDLAAQFGVKRLFSVGGVLGGVPHTKEPTVSCTVSDSRLKEEMASYAVRFSNYEGPSTFNTMLVATCQERGLEALHFTGRALFYPDFNIVVKRDARTIYTLLIRLRRLLGIDIDLSDLRKEKAELEDRLNFMVSQNSRLSGYVSELERSFEELRYEEPLQGTPEDFVRDAEEFLRKQKDSEGNGRS